MVRAARISGDGGQEGRHLAKKKTGCGARHYYQLYFSKVMHPPSYGMADQEKMLSYCEDTVKVLPWGQRPALRNARRVDGWGGSAAVRGAA